MNARVRARVKKIVNALKPYDPERVILFGSAARGDADKDSDIDLAIIKETRARFLDRLGTVYDLIAPDFAMDVLVYTPAEFARMRDEGNSFVEEIQRDGIVIYERAKRALRESRPPGWAGDGFRKKRAQEEGRRWLEQAKSDLAVAKWNAQGGFHSAACFWAQQTAERALKAFLYFRGKRRVTGHSVAALIKECKTLDPDFDTLGKPVTRLDRYYIPTRYPNGVPDGVPAELYDADESGETIQSAETVLSLVARKIQV